MNSQTALIISEPPNVKHELGALGLTVDFVREVALQVAAAKAEALPVDPAGSEGIRGYLGGIRAIRLQLLLEGWRQSRNGNVEATVNDELGVQLLYQNVDEACNESHDPEAISAKGPGSRKLVEMGLQGELFEVDRGPNQEKGSQLGVVPKVWVLCVSSTEMRLKAEVSCPHTFQGDQYEGFSKRIFVVDEYIGDGLIERKGEDAPPADLEVRIQKK